MAASACVGQEGRGPHGGAVVVVTATPALAEPTNDPISPAVWIATLPFSDTVDVGSRTSSNGATAEQAVHASIYQLHLARPVSELTSFLASVWPGRSPPLYVRYSAGSRTSRPGESLALDRDFAAVWLRRFSSEGPRRAIVSNEETSLETIIRLRGTVVEQGRQERIPVLILSPHLHEL